MIDDATGRVRARFSEEETTEASYDVFERWARRWGVPWSLYADRDSIYQCEREPTVAEQLAGVKPKTQFGRAMERLGMKLFRPTLRKPKAEWSAATRRCRTA